MEVHFLCGRDGHHECRASHHGSAPSAPSGRPRAPPLFPHSAPVAHLDSPPQQGRPNNGQLSAASGTRAAPPPRPHSEHSGHGGPLLQDQSCLPAPWSRGPSGAEQKAEEKQGRRGQGDRSQDQRQSTPRGAQVGHMTLLRRAPGGQCPRGPGQEPQKDPRAPPPPAICTLRLDQCIPASQELTPAQG